MKRILLILFFIAAGTQLFADFSFSSGTNSIEFSGLLTTIYNHRFYDEQETDLKKNHFALKDAQFKVEGLVYKIFEYELQMDLANLLVDRIDKEDLDTIIQDAFVEIDLPVDIKIGYQKIPYSFLSMCTMADSPFLDRYEFIDEAIYRRDVGLTVKYKFWKQRINLYAGAYNGDGKILKNTDGSGFPEFVARISAAYPSRYRYDEVDLKVSPIPLFAVGANVRYTQKDTDIVNDDDDNYPLMVNGKRLVIGADAAASFMGFSAQAEYHLLKGIPSDSSSIFLAIESDSFLANAYVMQANYYIKPINTILAVRYDNIDSSSLILDNNRRTICYGINYLFRNEYAAAIKLNYFQHLPTPAGDEWKEDEIRLSLQLKF